MNQGDLDRRAANHHGRSRFATTRWTVVRAAGGSLSNESRSALESLCQSYWYPLYAYVRRRGYSAVEAQDVTQEFITTLLEKKSMARACPERGRFRSFLLGSLNKFLVDWRRRDRAQKRGGDRTVYSIDVRTAEDRYLHEPVDRLTPARIFDRRWALTVLATVLDRLEAKYQKAGRAELFTALKPHLTHQQDSTPYQDIAAELSVSESAVKVAAHRLRKQYRAALQAEIIETVSSPKEMEDEIAHLFRCIGS